MVFKKSWKPEFCVVFWPFTNTVVKHMCVTGSKMCSFLTIMFSPKIKKSLFLVAGVKDENCSRE